MPIYYVDCMDKQIGLPSLPDNSIDLLLSDIPWDVDYQGYKDNYGMDWHKIWFKEAERICRGIIIQVGGNKWIDWVRYKIPKMPFYWYRNNTIKKHQLDFFLCYGTITNISHIREVIELPVIPHKHIEHPTPKPLKLYLYILSKLKPKNILDPFMGSGTTALACERLGIPYIGYEIDKKYEKDYLKRRNKSIINYVPEM